MPLNETTSLPWHHNLYNWQPFRIDALGLVTLLGAEEINSSLGRLVTSRYLEYFPLLGAFVIAGERFKEKRSSFNFYNITDGINTTDLSFWLTRWMIEQEFHMTRSIVHFEVPDEPRPFFKWHLVSAALACVFVGFLMAMTIVIGDWYGFANAIAMIFCISTRTYSLQVHRNAIDRAILKAMPKEQYLHPDKKCIVIMSDSKVVTMHLPGKLIVPVFSRNPEPLHPGTYHLIRYVGWVFFGIHIVTIGMATLLPQIYTVALLVVPSVLICWKLGCDDSKWHEKFDRRVMGRPIRYQSYECWIGTRLKAYISEWPVDVEFYQDEEDAGKPWRRHHPNKVMVVDDRSSRRQDLYAWLNLSPDEEDSLAKWDLFPHVRNGNESWWRTYKAKQALIAGNPPELKRKKTSVVVGTASVDESTESDSSPPSTSGTVLTSNGFVVGVPGLNRTATATASVRAGMLALLPGLDPSNIALRPVTNRRGYTNGSETRSDVIS